VIILMARPWCHPDTGVRYLRSRLPADLAKSLGGQKATFEVAGAESTVKLAPIFKVSLRTKDAGEARLHHASLQAQLHERWVAARDGAVALSHKEITALAGLWYRDLLADHQDEPGEADNWATYQDFLQDGLAYFDPDGDGIEREPYDPKQGLRILSRWFNIDNFLAARGLNVDHQSRARLVEHVAIAQQTPRREPKLCSGAQRTTTPTSFLNAA
jgi:hypothetical protein